MFSYTLPELINSKVEILSVRPAKGSHHIPENKLMKEFIKRHFPNGTTTVLNGSADLEIVKYLKAQKDAPMVVLGAYRRGTVSRWFKESMADTIMKEIKLPLFIAHNK
jgi:nucleotide-binding universal stress UspA family protein